jgi:hypothetical protein
MDKLKCWQSCRFLLYLPRTNTFSPPLPPQIAWLDDYPFPYWRGKRDGEQSQVLREYFYQMAAYGKSLTFTIYLGL